MLHPGMCSASRSESMELAARVVEGGVLGGPVHGVVPLEHLPGVQALEEVGHRPLVVGGAWLGGVSGAVWGLTASMGVTWLLAGTALAAYHALGCRDWARVDIRLDAQGQPNLLEVNPLPGILPDPEQNSCYPKAARAAGMDYQTMIVSVLEAALKRYGMGGGKAQ